MSTFRPHARTHAGGLFVMSAEDNNDGLLRGLSNVENDEDNLDVRQPTTTTDIPEPPAAQLPV